MWMTPGRIQPSFKIGIKGRELGDPCGAGLEKWMKDNHLRKKRVGREGQGNYEGGRITCCLKKR